jgi:hypothetical protein
MKPRNDINHFEGGALMYRQRHMLVLAIILFVLCGGTSLFVADQAYGICTGCCKCVYGGGYKYCPGCTPPGQQYDSITCPTCAVPDPEAIRASTPRYNGLSGMRAVRELSPFPIRQLDTTEGVLTLMRGAQCLRRSVEMRLLGDAGEGLSLYWQNGLEQPVQFEIAAQAN